MRWNRHASRVEIMRGLRARAAREYKEAQRLFEAGKTVAAERKFEDARRTHEEAERLAHAIAQGRWPSST